MRLDQTKRHHAIILAASLAAACLISIMWPLFPAHAKMTYADTANTRAAQPVPTNKAATADAEAIGTGGVGILTAGTPAVFAGSSACASCHPDETRAGSPHNMPAP